MMRVRVEKCNRNSQECTGEKNKRVTGGMEVQRVGTEL